MSSLRKIFSIGGFVVKILVLSLFATAVAFAQSSDQIRTTLVQITGPNTKSIEEKFYSELSKANLSIAADNKNWIPEFVTLNINVDSLSDREVLSLMRSLAVEAANCPGQAILYIPANEQSKYLSDCYAHALNQNLWNSINYGSWDSRAKSENKVAVVSFGTSLSYKKLLKSEVKVIKGIVAEINSDLSLKKARVPSKVIVVTLE